MRLRDLAWAPMHISGTVVDGISPPTCLAQESSGALSPGCGLVPLKLYAALCAQRCLLEMGAEGTVLFSGMLRRWDDSQKYLSDNPHLVCEETANYLVIWCIDLEVEEVRPMLGVAAYSLVRHARLWPALGESIPTPSPSPATGSRPVVNLVLLTCCLPAELIQLWLHL